MRTDELGIVPADKLVDLELADFIYCIVDLTKYMSISLKYHWINSPTRLVLKLDTNPENLLLFASWLRIIEIKNYSYLVTNNPDDDEWDACFVLIDWK